VAAYLRAQGWSDQPSRVPGVIVFTKTIPDADGAINIVLPETPGFGDERQRIADALRTIEAVEERSITAIAMNMSSKQDWDFDTEAGEGMSFLIGPYTFRPHAQLLVSSDGKEVNLTDKETAILRYLYRARQRPVSREM